MGRGIAVTRVVVGAVSMLMLASVARAECDSSQTSKPSSSRYVVQGGSVYDKKTDLTWMRCSQGQKWKDDLGCVGVAEKLTKAKADRGFAGGWRVPTVDELKTIVAKNCKNPAIDEELFPDTPTEWYRTSTMDGSRCWTVNFSDGRADNYGCASGYAVRLVRSGR